MNYKSFFWLHIKKSAGISTRKLLQPYYTEVDRAKKPYSFIQGNKDEYNDILNNYRVVLGEYQFKRALFAKTFLYPDDWSNIYSFAFSRNPLDRCVSMFYYLYYKQSDSLLTTFVRGASNLKKFGKLGLSASSNFDIFLDIVAQIHAGNSDSNFEPFGLHFSTHTAPMFPDITDVNGNLILTKIYRLENLNFAIREVFESCGLEFLNSDHSYLNKNKDRGDFNPNSEQLKKIEFIYKEDFELYESAK